MYVPLTQIRALYRAVDFYGKKTGAVSGERRFTYREFGERGERLAFGLLSEAVLPGDRVAYLSFNTHQLLEGYFGAPLIRGIMMPLNVRLTPAELTAILNHAEPRVLVYEPDFAPLIEQLRQFCPSVQRWVESGAPYEELLARGRIQRPDIFTFDERGIAELFYTSGSTDTLKGVMLSHPRLYMHMLSVSATFYNGETMMELHTIPLFHANGWGRPRCATFHGLTPVMVRRFEPAQVLRLIQEEKATSMSMVPTMANAPAQLRRIGKLRRLQFAPDSSGRRGILAGTGGMLGSRVSLPRHGRATGSPRHRQWPPVRAISPPCASPTRRKARHRAMTGWPLPGCEVRVVDMQMNDVPRDMQSIGEIVMSGDNTMDGHFKEPKATADVMTNGWLHTGDMAVWDEENYVHIVDRKNDIIISGGENISSIEVERAIAAHPAVLECAIVSAPDSQWGEVPAAFVVVKPGQALDQRSLCDFLQERIAKFKMPRRFQFSDTALPKTGTGNILKRELRETFWGGKDSRMQG